MNNKETITKIIETYFEGLHTSNVELLKNVFHEDCVLKAPDVRRTRDEWLALVSSRPVPAKQGTDENYEILWLEIEGNQALAKVSVPLLGAHYIDYLGLLFEGHRWQIVNKMYADKV